MLTMIVTASDAELAALRSAPVLDPAGFGLATVDLRGISPYALVTLHACVCGVAVDDVLVGRVLDEPLEIRNDGEQVLFRTLPEFAAATRSSGDDALTAAATAWAATDELQADGWSTDQCRAVLQDLRSLALSDAGPWYALLSV